MHRLALLVIASLTIGATVLRAAPAPRTNLDRQPMVEASSVARPSTSAASSRPSRT